MVLIFLFIAETALLGPKFHQATSPASQKIATAEVCEVISAASFEMADTPERFAHQLNPPCGAPGNARVLRVQTWFDFILIFLYWSLFCSFAMLGGQSLQPMPAVLKICVSLAAVLDVLKNIGLLLQLKSPGHPALAKLTHHASIGKWGFFSATLAITGLLLLSRRAKGVRRPLFIIVGMFFITAGVVGTAWLLTPQPQFHQLLALYMRAIYFFLALGLAGSIPLLLTSQEVAVSSETGASQNPEPPAATSTPAPPRPDAFTPGGGGDDAVCFTAGLTGAYFGAGVIHAYLAARRKNPVVAAGISLGAVSAAAMQKCYRNLQNAPPPSAGPSQTSSDGFWRWSWYREYVRSLTDRPLAVIWDALPDMSDFFADMPPVRDKSLPKRDEAEARNQRYILIKLGRRLANLPISVRIVVETVIYYVRKKERYGNWFRARFWSRAAYLAVECCGFVFAPVYDNFFKSPKKSGRKPTLVDARPLFGWDVWLVTMAVILCLLFLVGCLVANLALFVDRFDLVHRLGSRLFWVSGATALALMLSLMLLIKVRLFLPEYAVRDKLRSFLKFAGVWIVAWLAVADLCLLLRIHWIESPRESLATLHSAWSAPDKWAVGLVIASRVLALLVLLMVVAGWLAWTYQKRKAPDSSLKAWLAGFLLEGIELNKQIITDFYVVQRLKQLFDPEAERERRFRETVSDTPMPVLLVSASLQSLQIAGTGKKGAQQIWPTAGVHLVQALRASIAKPGLMAPVPISGKELDMWLDRSCYACEKLTRLDLVDGAVIRQNPLPALFAYLNRHKTMAAKLSRPGHPSIHVVFNVPLEPRQDAPGKPMEAPTNIVDVALLSLKLAERRDTKMEVQQTNFVSKLENLIIDSGCESGLRRWGEEKDDLKGGPLETLPLSADCIGPEEDIDIGPPLSPCPEKAMQTIAAGCRQTLQRLYAEQLATLMGALPCRRLLGEVWLQNLGRRVTVPDLPGLPEVCRACSGLLQGTAPVKRNTLSLSDQDFPELNGEKPRVVFVASGGVFRGAFQVGVLAALLKTGIKIDLAVGASVGTLMGSALAAAASSNSQEVRDQVVRDLYLTFLEVDEKVALTAPLKSAIREIGVRGRSIHLSPSEVQRMINRGSRFDPGFAVAGAPPALLDAISALFALPYEDTKRIASCFVSGHIVEAVTELLRQMKKETLERLGIEEYLMGVSLLQITMERLLFPHPGLDRLRAQPYLEHGRGVAVFGTTTNLLTWESKLLGDPAAFSGKYNFLEAALSSSAFPAVFQPRRETDVYPGHGDPRVLYSDGGMFDNLPFIPALNVLTCVQTSRQNRLGSTLSDKEKLELSMRSLKKRHAAPDLFIVGSLDAEPESGARLSEGQFNSILSVRNRAAQLNANLKISDFELAGVRVHDQVERLVGAATGQMPAHAGGLLNAIVDAAVLPIYPVDRMHLNPTFAFCRTLELEPQRIRRTVSNGCFQTLLALAKAQAFRPDDHLSSAAQYDPLSFRARTPEEVLSKSVWALVREGKVPYIAKSDTRLPTTTPHDCPYFKRSPSWQEPTLNGTTGQPEVVSLPCPFAGSPEAEVAEVFKTCCSDQLNRQAAAAFTAVDVPVTVFAR